MEAPVARQAEQYVRQARRLRARHRANAPALQRSLERLAHQTDHAPAALPSSERFAGEVRGVMDGPVLSYSNRMKLLKRAGELRIGKFEANLIIATTVYRNAGRERETKSWPTLLPTMLAVSLIQGLIVLGAWWLVR